MCCNLYASIHAVLIHRGATLAECKSRSPPPRPWTPAPRLPVQTPRRTEHARLRQPQTPRCPTRREYTSRLVSAERQAPGAPLPKLHCLSAARAARADAPPPRVVVDRSPPQSSRFRTSSESAGEPGPRHRRHSSVEAVDLAVNDVDAARADASFEEWTQEPQPQRTARRSRAVPTGSILAAGRVDAANAALLADLRRCVPHA